MTCSDLQRSLVSAGSAAEAIAGDARDHLLGCDGCRALLLARGLAGEGADDPAAAGTACASAEALAGFLDGTLQAGRRDDLAAHLAACGPCRLELLALADDLGSLGEPEAPATAPAELERRAEALAGVRGRRIPRRWPLRLAAPLAAAAALGLVLVGLGVRDMIDERRAGAPGGGERVLRGADDGAPRLAAPRGAVRLERGSLLRFEWTPGIAAGAGAATPRYRLVVAALDGGEPVLDVAVEADSLELSAEETATLRPGVRYHWMLVPVEGTPGEASEAVAFTLE